MGVAGDFSKLTDPAEIKKMAVTLAENEIKEATGGRVTKMPADMAEATGMAKDIVVEEGKKWIKKKTGLKEVPTDVEGVKSAAKKMADSYVNKTTGGKLSRL